MWSRNKTAGGVGLQRQHEKKMEGIWPSLVDVPLPEFKFGEGPFMVAFLRVTVKGTPADVVELMEVVVKFWQRRCCMTPFIRRTSV